MNLLAIETSTDIASLALWANNQWYQVQQDAARSHARLLLPLIENLLTEAAVSFSALSGIAYGSGPGSFTGLRIACSIAKGLAFAHDLPLYPVSSLTAIAMQARQTKPGADVLALLDARMNQVYWAFFKDNQHSEERVSDAAEIECFTERPYVLAGVGWELYHSALPVTLQQQCEHTMTVYPNAQRMIDLVLAGQIQPVQAADALPVYVRNQVTQGDQHG